MDWQRWIKGVSQEHLFFVLRSLMVAHLSEHRDSWEIKARAGSWSLDTTIDRDGIDIDSLDLIAIASRVNQMFHLHEAGTEDYLLARRRFADLGSDYSGCLGARREQNTVLQFRLHPYSHLFFS